MNALIQEDSNYIKLLLERKNFKIDTDKYQITMFIKNNYIDMYSKTLLIRNFDF